jgi:hypothetical protein
VAIELDEVLDNGSHIAERRWWSSRDLVDGNVHGSTRLLKRLVVVGLVLDPEQPRPCGFVGFQECEDGVRLERLARETRAVARALPEWIRRRFELGFRPRTIATGRENTTHASLIRVGRRHIFVKRLPVADYEARRMDDELLGWPLFASGWRRGLRWRLSLWRRGRIDLCQDGAQRV